jgi:hypothetical protein
VRLAGVAQVRNEADIIEAFVRHHLARVDVLYVVDHRSEDGTRAMLDALVAEQAPLVVMHDDEPAQRQAHNMTRLARQAFEAGADAVLALDADEFLKMADRAAFERWLARLPADLCAALEWQTYVPDFARPATHPLAAARARRLQEAHGLHKVVLTRAFRDAGAASVGPGNHTVLMAGPAQDLARQPVRLARVPPALAALGHLPVRNAAQLRTKIALGWRAHQAAAPDDAALAFHWQELHAELAAGTPTPARLRDIACNYGVPMARWEPADRVALVDDPLPADTVLRYGGLARVLDVMF